MVFSINTLKKYFNHFIEIFIVAIIFAIGQKPYLATVRNAIRL